VAAKRKGKVTAQPGRYAFRALKVERGELTCADKRRRIAPLIAVGRKGEDAMALTIRVNGNTHSVDVDDDTPLLWVLRDVLGMTGTKFGCGMALCGACTVHVDGAPTRSCITPIDSVGTSEITTIEAIGATAAGTKIQKAWLDREVPQCGYCQSGQIMSAAALLASNPRPTDSDIDDAMSGNICRCGTYVRIRDAIKQAAQSI
jgi:isoquinoline 1-oxidoreductase subunit alpha